MDEVAERLGRLCAQAGGGALAERAARYGVGDVLDRLQEAVRSGTAGPGLLADLRELDEAFARHGIDGLTTGARAYVPFAGGRPHPVVTLWGCPADRPCNRLEPRAAQEVRAAARDSREARTGDAEPPLCALTGAPLRARRFRL
ncbi:hypothetical protein ACFPM3_06020 [Streptomyces coeruleoprunus]|uniref:Uncharacterized protein n=1 Tax=Streptomyces coeruleoprunus TaxID=285563 RepID=A0ABV9X8Y0_9ACTN